MSRKKRILLLAEGVTASQIVRLVTLGRALDPTRFDVSFACANFDPKIFGNTNFRQLPVHSPDPQAVLRAVRQGRRLYNQAALRAQVKEDLQIFETTKPDLVVGDFRWSLAVSAKVYGVPHAALVNAYWSPYAQFNTFPVPDHPLVRLLGEELTARYFPVAMPRVFAWFAEPLNAVRRDYGLPAIGSLPEVLTYGDYTLYADPEGLVPTVGAPATHLHLGFVPWAPDVPLPPDMDASLPQRPLVYATLGSSGNIDILPRVLEALERLPVTALIATAGRRNIAKVGPNVMLQEFVPGDVAARMAAVVITNGGSSSSYQALAEGTPVLGLPSNLDQFLAMQAIERHGAGLMLRARALTTDTLVTALHRLLDTSSYRTAAQTTKRMLDAARATERFAHFVTNATHGKD